MSHLESGYECRHHFLLTLRFQCYVRLDLSTLNHLYLLTLFGYPANLAIMKFAVSFDLIFILLLCHINFQLVVLICFLQIGGI